MARITDRLTDVQVKKARGPRRYHDGHGLYLQVTKTDTKSWLFRFMRDGQERYMGLGTYPEVTLAEARDLAANARKQARVGTDPIDQRVTEKAAARSVLLKEVTFRQFANSHVESRKPGWSNPKHAAQWPSTLRIHAFPVLGDMPIDGIQVDDVLKVLQPIWMKIPETANRLRQRIETVLDAAAARGHRSKENPARWRGLLDKLLPRQAREVRHHPSLPYAEVPSFYAELRGRDAMSARALTFLILTAARTCEVRRATWSEIDLVAKTWTVPASHMKSKREHKVPLNADAIAVLELVGKTRREDDPLIFQSDQPGKPMSENTMLKYLKEDMHRPDLTVHGFRSTFRVWATERGYPWEVAEAALAHALKDKTQAAYMRSDLLDLRRPMMEGWAAHCMSPTAADVIPFRKAV